MVTPSWWPYRATPKDVGKKLFFIVTGIIIGTKIITNIYHPYREYEEGLERGKIELLRKYKTRFDQRKNGAIGIGISQEQQQK
uniref:Uncharacterized protein n=1 Tax=Panagrolaimus sp. ES5 TaxID=591445 RepID=A0AC34FJC2_9BILA